MKDFTDLFVRLDQTNSTNEKVAAMVDYFSVAPPEDAAWAIWFLTGRRLKRLIPRADLRQWLLQVTGYSEWMLEETYQTVGDMAETIALLLPEPDTSEITEWKLHEWVELHIRPLPSLDESERSGHVKKWWRHLPNDQRFVLNKLITGALRVGVSQRLVVRALAEYTKIDTAVIAHRLMGNWTPDANLMARLADPDTTAVEVSTPYPFFLASALQDSEPRTLGEYSDWQAEWKWDGIRAQLIRRNGEIFLWSRGEELLQGRFPEIDTAANSLLDGTVMDGEILPWQNDTPLAFAQLQRRIGRLKPGKKLLTDVPVIYMAYDLIEFAGNDIRTAPLRQRRDRLEQCLQTADEPILKASPLLEANNWKMLASQREKSRALAVEGIMLKRKSSPYRTGRTRGDWWKWKIDPLTIDAVLLYAQPGSGRRSNLLTDYTFAVWKGDELVPVCKAYSGLTNDEIADLDRWIRRHTKERFGPVRSVKPEHVFEIAFEGIAASTRHKSGVAFRFPRIARWRHDLSIADAETLSEVELLLTPPLLNND